MSEREGVAFFRPDTLPDDLFRQWFAIAPTQRQVEAQLALEQKSEDAARAKERRESWRLRHPDSLCSDAIADILSEWEQTYLRRPWGA